MGVWIKSLGSFGVDPGCLKSPIGLAVGLDGNIVVAEMDNDRVQILSPEGEFIRMVNVNEDSQRKPSGFRSPWGVKVDSQGNIVVVNASSLGVKIFSPTGELLMNLSNDTLLKKTSVSMQTPRQAAIDPRNGNILIFDDSCCIFYFG